MEEGTLCFNIFTALVVFSFTMGIFLLDYSSETHLLVLLTKEP